jgi:hypothetical protein
MDLQSISNDLEIYQAQTYGVQSQDSTTDGTTTTAEKTSKAASYDTYVPGDSAATEDIGIYQPVKSAEGDTAVQFNAPAQAGAGAGAAGGASSSSSSDDELDDLEDELEELQEEEAKLTKQLNATTDEEQAEKLQKQLDQLENKITEKQSEIYQAETDSEE